MMQNAWRSIEEVPYCFLGSSIKFLGHTGWKIDDLNPIWVRLPGRSQLSNPSDLPCFIWFFISTHNHNFVCSRPERHAIWCYSVVWMLLICTSLPCGSVLFVCLLESDNVRYWDDNVMCWHILHPAPGLRGMCSALDNSCDTLTIMQLISL